jgi:vacuolar-type H+-ATPase subunit H
LWYSTTSKGREDVVGDKARAEYFSQWEQNCSENFKKWKQSVLSDEAVQETQKIKQVKLRLEDMTLEQLELDAETQEIVSNALEHSRMPIADFIRQACKVYAKTLTGKAKQSTEDLSTIPTNELREGKAYKTHPGRAEELVKRAIQAITLHNGQATEVNQKWLITQTLLLEMTGSKIPTIQELVGRKAKDGTVLKTGKYQTNVDDINKRLKDDYGVDDYLNRKPKEVKEKFIEEWVTLVPNGLDDFNSSPMPDHIIKSTSTTNSEKK